MHIIGSLLKPTSGCVLIDGEDIYKMPDAMISKFRNENIGFVFQNFYLEESYTAYENVELPLLIARKKNNSKRVEELLSYFGILDKKKEKVSNLSGGEKQRVALARAIVNNPKYLLCDEPTGNLDSNNSKIVYDYLKELSKNILVIVVTHDVELFKDSDYIYELQNGELVCIQK